MGPCVELVDLFFPKAAPSCTCLPYSFFFLSPVHGVFILLLLFLSPADPIGSPGLQGLGSVQEGTEEPSLSLEPTLTPKRKAANGAGESDDEESSDEIIMVLNDVNDDDNDAEDDALASNLLGMISEAANKGSVAPGGMVGAVKKEEPPAPEGGIVMLDSSDEETDTDGD